MRFHFRAGQHRTSCLPTLAVSGCEAATRRRRSPVVSDGRAGTHCWLTDSIHTSTSLLLHSLLACDSILEQASTAQAVYQPSLLVAVRQRRDGDAVQLS